MVLSGRVLRGSSGGGALSVCLEAEGAVTALLKCRGVDWVHRTAVMVMGWKLPK